MDFLQRLLHPPGCSEASHRPGTGTREGHARLLVPHTGSRSRKPRIMVEGVCHTIGQRHWLLAYGSLGRQEHRAQEHKWHARLSAHTQA